MRTSRIHSRCRAFSLLELLVVIMLLSVAALVFTRQFHSLFTVLDRVPKSTQESSRYHGMLRRLSQDVWTAEKAAVASDRQLDLFSGSTVISWTIAEDGALLRRQDGNTMRYPVNGHCVFNDDGILLSLKTPDDTIPLSNAVRLSGGKR